MENNDRLQEATKIIAEMNKDSDLNRVEEMIKENKITFSYEEKQYRVRVLNIREKEELDGLRRKKFGQLMQDKDILLEKDLIKVYKERGIDIDKIDAEIKKLETHNDSLYLKCGEAISKNESETILKSYRDQIYEIDMIKIPIFNAQKTLLLEFSLENQLLNYVAMIITYLSLDILEDGIWKRLFSTFEEFQNYNNEELINKAGSYSMLLQYKI